MPELSPETTDLERRVLAHERVLQALIAFIAREEPRFVDHLRERFVDTMRTARHEQDYRETDDYAEEFIRAVMQLGNVPAADCMKPEAAGHDRSGADREEGKPVTGAPQKLDRVQVRERNGIWEVKVDGAFRGDYHQREHAVAAAALHKLSLQRPVSLDRHS